MTKSELIKKISLKYPDMFLKDIQILVETMLDEIVEALKQGRRVELRGFGAFTSKKRDARVARNPRTNEEVKVAERVSVYFRTGKELNERLNIDAL